MKLAALVGAVCLAVLGACSSIVEGTSQQIAVSTESPGATCNLLREGVSIARVSPTPGTVTIDKTKHDITVECELANYQKATYLNKSEVAGATLGNIILGGGIGWAIDSASGADNKYTSPVTLALIPATHPASSPEPARTASASQTPSAQNTPTVQTAAVPAAIARQAGVDGEYRTTVPANLFNGNPAFEMRITAHGGRITGYGMVPRTAPMHCHAKGSMRADGDAYFDIDCATGGIGAVQTFRISGRFAPEPDGQVTGRTSYHLSSGPSGTMIWRPL
jgi:hypothetical protein